ncbi:MAG: lytic transglycosylase domain-containing protein [Holosporales bacterium]|jgi:hypothetical protein|nr:lytic transglycosylase domain-containing protein [Holosporales bacterium]
MLFILAFFIFPFPAEGSSIVSPYSETSIATNTCLTTISEAENTYGIPAHLLEAIARVESGRSVDGTPPSPWPWTVTVNGKGHYFPTKLAAIAAVKKFQTHGIRNIDVGCMQVNLLHHPKAFKSLNEAFDITQNVAYAAKFLKGLQVQHASWPKAVGCYHSATTTLHVPYRHRVFETWAKVRQRPWTVPLQRPYSLFAAHNKPRHKLFKKSVVQKIAYRAEKPMSAFYASLNRRTSGKIYQASLCREHAAAGHNL